MFPLEQVPRLTRSHSPPGLHLHGVRGVGEVTHFSEVARRGPSFLKTCPLWTRTVRGGGSRVTDATRAGVCDTRSAINWIEDVGEDNDSLVALSFFLHNELDGGEKRPLGRRKRRKKKNPHTSKRSIPVGKCQKRSRIPRRK